jgi:arsenate reductase
MPADRHVLFLCTSNSARSLMAEAIITRESQGRVQGHSAGSDPADAPDRHAIDVLESLGYDTAGLHPKSWEDFAGPDAPEMTYVFTLCDDAAQKTCPVWPGQPVTAHWSIPDPAATTGTEAQIGLAYAEAYRMLYRRISVFLSLPAETLESLRLPEHLEEIGRTGERPEGS